MIFDTLENGIKLVMQAYLIGVVAWLFFVGFYIVVKVGVYFIKRWL